MRTSLIIWHECDDADVTPKKTGELVLLANEKRVGEGFYSKFQQSWYWLTDWEANYNQPTHWAFKPDSPSSGRSGEDPEFNALTIHQVNAWWIEAQLNNGIDPIPISRTAFECTLKEFCNDH